MKTLRRVLPIAALVVACHAPRLRRDRPHLRLGHGLRRQLAEVLRLLVSADQPARSHRRSQRIAISRRSSSLTVRHGVRRVAWRRATTPASAVAAACCAPRRRVGAVFAAALLGGVTVKIGNAPWATVAHWLVAMTLLAWSPRRRFAPARSAARAMRAARLGARRAVDAPPRRSAIFAVALGGLTAKYPGAAVACTTFPLCGANPAVDAGRCTCR